MIFLHMLQWTSVVANGEKVQIAISVQLQSRDATIPFFQIRSDPENSEYRPIPIRSDTSTVIFLFFFINVEFLYFCVTLLCVKHIYRCISIN